MHQRWLFSINFFTVSSFCRLPSSSPYTTITQIGDEGSREASALSKAKPLDWLNFKGRDYQPLATLHEGHGVHLWPTGRVESVSSTLASSDRGSSLVQQSTKERPPTVDQAESAIRRARLPSDGKVVDSRSALRAKPTPTSPREDKSGSMRNLKEIDYLYPRKMRKYIGRLRRHRQLMREWRRTRNHLYPISPLNSHIAWQTSAQWMLKSREALSKSSPLALAGR